MEEFEERKQKYLNKLKDILFTERMGIIDYAMHIGERNLDKISNPRAETELDLAERALNIFIELKKIPERYEFNPDTNTAYIANYIIYKSLRNPQYMESAIEFLLNLSSCDYLIGKTIVDNLVLPEDAFASVIEYEAEKLGVLQASVIISFMIYRNEIMFECMQRDMLQNKSCDDTEPGIQKYIQFNECAFMYLNERGTHPEEDIYVETYRKKLGM